MEYLSIEPPGQKVCYGEVGIGNRLLRLSVPFKRWLIQPQWARPGGFIRVVGWEEPNLEPRTGRRVPVPPYTALGPLAVLLPELTVTGQKGHDSYQYQDLKHLHFRTAQP